MGHKKINSFSLDFAESCRNHHVSYLYHYTHPANMELILRHGLLSRREMRDKNIHPYKVHGWGHKTRELENYICLCLFPPLGMLRQHNDMKMCLWISINVLSNKDVLFSSYNSANDFVDSSALRNTQDIEGFESLFIHAQSSVTKNKMAEILVPNRIDTKHIHYLSFKESRDISFKNQMLSLVGFIPPIRKNDALF